MINVLSLKSSAPHTVSSFPGDFPHSDGVGTGDDVLAQTIDLNVSPGGHLSWVPLLSGRPEIQGDRLAAHAPALPQIEECPVGAAGGGGGGGGGSRHEVTTKNHNMYSQLRTPAPTV